MFVVLLVVVGCGGSSQEMTTTNNATSFTKVVKEAPELDRVSEIADVLHHCDFIIDVHSSTSGKVISIGESDWRRYLVVENPESSDPQIIVLKPAENEKPVDQVDVDNVDFKILLNALTAPHCHSTIRTTLKPEPPQVLNDDDQSFLKEIEKTCLEEIEEAKAKGDNHLPPSSCKSLAKASLALRNKVKHDSTGN
jgi:hypothetical protein